jgi:glycosyltransferase involved in cell wall biosynthesis
MGHEVLIVSAEYPENLYSIETALMESVDTDYAPKILRVPSNFLPISKEDPLARFEKWFWLRKRVDAFCPDIIHAHSEFVIGNFAVLYAKTRKKPLIYTFHTLWEDYVAGYVPYLAQNLVKKTARNLSKNMCIRATSVIAPTRHIEGVIRRYGVRKHIYLLPTGIDPHLFSGHKELTTESVEQFFQRFPKLRDKRFLLFAGRVGKEKNLEFLLEVLEKVQKAVPGTMLCIAGDGPWLETLKEEAETKNLSDSIVFTGYMDRSRMPAVYSAAAVFTFSSKTETQGLVTIEAMLSGLPVVAIGEMGTVDVMQGDNGGFMVQDNVDEFSERVIQLLTDPALYEAKRQDALNYGRNWTIDALTVKLTHIYSEIIVFYDKYIKNRKWYQFW